MQTRTTHKYWLYRLGVVVAALVMVLSNFIAAVPVVLSAATNAENITVAQTHVETGTKVKATIAGATPSDTQQQVIKLTGSGLAFDTETSEAKEQLKHDAYTVSEDGKTLTLKAGQTMPFDLYLTTTNSGDSDVQGTIEATASGTVNDKITQTITIKPAAAASASSSSAVSSSASSSAASATSSTASSASSSSASASSAVKRVTRVAATAVPATVDGTKFNLSPQAAASDVNAPSYKNYGITNFPLYYIKDTDSSGNPMYAAAWNSNTLNTSASDVLAGFLKPLYAGNTTVTAGGAQTSDILQTANNAGALFSNFTQYDSAGKATETKFTNGKAYQLISANPLAGTKGSFARLSTGLLSGYYYLPNTTTLPTVTFKNDGTTNSLSISNYTEGAGVYGQYKADGTTLKVNMFKVKEVRVVDDSTGKAIPNATVKFTDMQAVTGSGTSATDSSSVGEMLPQNYTKGGAFYYGKGTDNNGTQKITGISFTGASDYILPVGATVSLDQANDKLTTDSTDPTSANVKTNETVSVGSNRTMQVVTVHVQKRSSLTTEQSGLSIKKIDATSKAALGGAKFAVSEDASDNDANQLTATTTAATDNTSGVVTTPITASGTNARIIKLQEKQAPTGYVRDDTVYYAKWVLGKGFTAVGTTTNPTATTAGNLSLDGGTLVFADKKGTTPVVTSQYRMQYRMSTIAGTGINGAALPQMPNMSTITSADGLETYSGLSGLLLPNGSADFSSTKAATLAADGVTYNNDSAMAASTAVSGPSDAGGPGVGRFQSLWTQTALPVSTGSNDLYAQINAAIKNQSLLGAKSGTIGYLNYTITNPDMMGRAASGTDAYNYYTFAQTMNIYGTDGTNIGGSVVQTNPDYATNTTNLSGNTLQVALQKVKTVKVVDTTGKTVAAKALYKSSNGAYMVTNSAGELVPANSDGSVKTSGFFAWPSGTLSLVKLTDTTTGQDITPTDPGGAISLDTAHDYLSMANPTASAKIDSSAQYRTILYTVPKTGLTMHVGGIVGSNATDGAVNSTAIAGAKFTITNQANTAQSYSGTSDASGNVTFDIPSTLTEATFRLSQDSAQVSGYSRITGDLFFHWTQAGGADKVGTSTAALSTNTATVATGGILTVSGGLSVGLPQRIVFNRSALYDTTKGLSTNSSDKFLVYEKGPDGIKGAAMNSFQFSGFGDDSYSAISLNATADPNTVRTFTVSDRSTAADPYVTNKTSYFFTYSAAQGVLSVGTTQDEAQATPANTMTSDHVASVQANRQTGVSDPEKNVFNLGLDRYYSLKALTLGPTSDSTNLAVSGAKIGFTGINNSTTAANMIADTASDGSTKVAGAELYKKLTGGTALPASGTFETNVFADGLSATSASGTAKYNGVDAHPVTFTFGSGFTTTNTDNVVFDQNNTAVDGAATSQLSAGGLGLYLRRYVLHTQALIGGQGLAGSFAVTFTPSTGGTAVTKQYNTDANGDMFLPDPVSLFSGENTAMATTYDVTITEVAPAPTGYVLNDTPIQMTYTSQQGYTKGSLNTDTAGFTDYVTTAPTPVAQTASATARNSWRDSDTTTTQATDTFMRNGMGAGTQVIYNLRDDASVNFTDVPAAGQNLNFGKQELSSTAHSADLQTAQSGDTLAGTTPTTLFDAAGDVGLRVRQTGNIPNGWTVTLTGTSFTPNDDSMTGSTITFANGQMNTLKDDGQMAGMSLISGRTVALGSGSTGADTMMRSSESGNVAGLYTAFWPTAGVKLNLPALAGGVDQVYSSALTWQLNVDTDETNTN